MRTSNSFVFPCLKVRVRIGALSLANPQALARLETRGAPPGARRGVCMRRWVSGSGVHCSNAANNSHITA